MTEKELGTEISLVIDFEKDSEKPARVFHAMSDMIEAFEEMDNTFIQSFDFKIEPILLLEEIKEGSLKTKLRTVLKVIDDESLKKIDWKPTVGKYLLKAKQKLIEFTNEQKTITDKKPVDKLRQEIHQLAEETKLHQMPVYNPVDNATLIKNLTNIAGALHHLNEKDKMKYSGDGDSVNFNLGFDVAPDVIEEILTEDTKTHKIPMILKVKKPDYLGKSKWEFRHGTQTIHATITDEQWLEDFQKNRKYDIKPGDSLDSDVTIVVRYDSDNEVISTVHEITNVKEVKPMPQHEQMKFFKEIETIDNNKKETKRLETNNKDEKDTSK